MGAFDTGGNDDKTVVLSPGQGSGTSERDGRAHADVVGSVQ